jgi:beta-glucosidase
MGRDARARGVHFILAPSMNIYRAPMNGRNFEYLGEDPYLASRMAVPLIEGIQSQGVIATAKHFVANNMEYGPWTTARMLTNEPCARFACGEIFGSLRNR